MRFILISMSMMASVMLSACDQAYTQKDTSKQPVQPHSAVLFEQQIQKPYWFYLVSSTRLNTSEDVSKLWQSEKRYGDDFSFNLNSKIFYKSCYKAIVAHPEDNELVVICLRLMDLAVEESERVVIAKYLLNHFSNHRQRTDNCANCMPADRVARVTLELSQYEKYENPQLAIQRLEQLLDTRLDEISGWVQVEIYVSLAEQYIDAGVTDERFQRFKIAYERLKTLKETNEPVSSRFEKLELLYDEMVGIGLENELTILND